MEWKICIMQYFSYWVILIIISRLWPSVAPFAVYDKFDKFRYFIVFQITFPEPFPWQVKSYGVRQSKNITLLHNKTMREWVSLQFCGKYWLLIPKLNAKSFTKTTTSEAEIALILLLGVLRMGNYWMIMCTNRCYGNTTLIAFLSQLSPFVFTKNALI